MLGNTLTLLVRNTTAQPQNWHAFGFNEGQSNPQGVLVSVQQSSEQQATRESATVPFVIDTIKIKSPSTDQMDQPIIIHAKDITGKLFEVQLTPSTYENPQYKQPNFIEIQNANIEISGNIGLQGVINGNTTLTMIINITKKKVISSFISSLANIFGSSQIKINYNIAPGTQIILK